MNVFPAHDLIGVVRSTKDFHVTISIRVRGIDGARAVEVVAYPVPSGQLRGCRRWDRLQQEE